MRTKFLSSRATRNHTAGRIELERRRRDGGGLDKAAVDGDGDGAPRCLSLYTGVKITGTAFVGLDQRMASVALAFGFSTLWGHRCSISAGGSLPVTVLFDVMSPSPLLLCVDIATCSHPDPPVA